MKEKGRAAYGQTREQRVAAFRRGISLVAATHVLGLAACGAPSDEANESTDELRVAVSKRAIAYDYAQRDDLLAVTPNFSIVTIGKQW